MARVPDRYGLLPGPVGEGGVETAISVEPGHRDIACRLGARETADHDFPVGLDGDGAGDVLLGGEGDDHLAAGAERRVQAPVGVEPGDAEVSGARVADAAGQHQILVTLDDHRVRDGDRAEIDTDLAASAERRVQVTGSHGAPRSES
nr:hypothetical protein [Streptomyces roseoverticillatus]